MLSLVGVPNLCPVLPIFDFLGLCEPLHAHVQASQTHIISSFTSLAEAMCFFQFPRHWIAEPQISYERRQQDFVVLLQ
jgi:hypothetical protein